MTQEVDSTSQNTRLMAFLVLLFCAGDLQYVMVLLKGSVPISYRGTVEPAAYGELAAVGGLNPDVNRKLSAGIAAILESKLSVEKSRFFLKFTDSKARYTIASFFNCPQI